MGRWRRQTGNRRYWSGDGHRPRLAVNGKGRPVSHSARIWSPPAKRKTDKVNRKPVETGRRWRMGLFRNRRPQTPPLTADLSTFRKYQKHTVSLENTFGSA